MADEVLRINGAECIHTCRAGSTVKWASDGSLLVLHPDHPPERVWWDLDGKHVDIVSPDWAPDLPEPTMSWGEPP